MLNSSIVLPRISFILSVQARRIRETLIYHCDIMNLHDVCSFLKQKLQFLSSSFLIVKQCMCSLFVTFIFSWYSLSSSFWERTLSNDMLWLKGRKKRRFISQCQISFSSPHLHFCEDLSFCCSSFFKQISEATVVALVGDLHNHQAARRNDGARCLLRLAHHK